MKDFNTIVRYAWIAYDGSRPIRRIVNISAKVSTNHVYRVSLQDGSIVIAKLSYFGQYAHFVEDHRIIHTLANNLPAPFDNFLAVSLMKGEKVFVHHFQNDLISAWVVFYRPIKIRKRLPRRLEEPHIIRLAQQFALFHRACHTVRYSLPKSSKTLSMDIELLQSTVQDGSAGFRDQTHKSLILEHCAAILNNLQEWDTDQLDRIPVFVDWNIGNFSVTAKTAFFSRWDYDWFRMSSRMLDFYFISRIVSDVGDRTAFSYHIGPLMEERFILFLKHYHEVYPLQPVEVKLLQEVYRFFLLHYVVDYGRYFFHTTLAQKLIQDVLKIHLLTIDTFDAGPLLKALKL